MSVVVVAADDDVDHHQVYSCTDGAYGTVCTQKQQKQQAAARRVRKIDKFSSECNIISSPLNARLINFFCSLNGYVCMYVCECVFGVPFCLFQI